MIDAGLESRKVYLPRGQETLFISGYVTFSETPEARQFASSGDAQSSWDDKAEETIKLEHEGQGGLPRMRRAGVHFNRKTIISFPHRESKRKKQNKTKITKKNKTNKQIKKPGICLGKVVPLGRVGPWKGNQKKNTELGH